MIVLNADATASALQWAPLIKALREGFKNGCDAPLRHHHTIAVPAECDASLLLMPAWQTGHHIGVKHVMVVPENHKRNLSSVAASYFLYSAISGEMLAIIDGAELTNRRTAAASALASTYLSRPDSTHLLIVGAGSLAPYLIDAHRSVRNISQVSVWNRNQSKAKALAERFDGHVVTDLAGACASADIISCATSSTQALIFGEHITPGTHVDLVGSFLPTMRESDSDLIQAATLFADTRDGVLNEGGDFIQPLNAGLIQIRDIKAELRELCLGAVEGRESTDEITVFKSVGTALEDLAAGVLAHDRAAQA